MLRSVLAWMLLAAFLVTVPVTGGGQCPCRFVNTLRTQTTPPAGRAICPTQASKGCCPRCHPDAPDHGGGDRQTPGRPTDVPCDHNLLVDAAPVGGAGERTGLERDASGDGLANGAWVLPLPHLTHTHQSASGLSASAPPSDRHFLRYAHAFRS